MEDHPDIDTKSPSAGQAQLAKRAPVRLPSPRASLLLATITLAVGLAVGAAVGPAPAPSFAGGASGLSQRLPLLIAAVRAAESSASPKTTSTATTQPPAVTSTATPKAAHATGKHSSAATTGQETAGSEEEPSKTKGTGTHTKTTKLPTITNVWLIELAGTSFEAADAQPTAAPYITGTLLPKATLLNSWSALQASAFAGDAALAEPPAAGATPPLLHSIVQPPCPEGAAGSTCAPETTGQITAADEFLKSVLTPITATAAYREGGLVVVTFASVGLASQAELPPGTSTATLTYKPPAGAVLLSSFAKAGQRSTVAFNPTSPRQSLEKLLH
jgi:hypothetical protein